MRTAERGRQRHFGHGTTGLAQGHDAAQLRQRVGHSAARVVEVVLLRHGHDELQVAQAAASARWAPRSLSTSPQRTGTSPTVRDAELLGIGHGRHAIRAHERHQLDFGHSRGQ